MANSPDIFPRSPAISYTPYAISSSKESECRQMNA
jgi:hypothetical protein